MDKTDLCFLSAMELRSLYQKGDLSPVEVTKAILNHIDHHNPRLNAFITTTPELALRQALKAELAYSKSEFPPPPLNGIPISFKDLTATKGIITTRGSLLYKNWIPNFNAPIVKRLSEAGAVFLGKTNTPELGWKGDSGNRLIGPTHNPWNHDCTAGGSSGGAAAAVAMGMGPLAQGTDGAGSIRIPASFCGLYGLKPSFGLIPQYPPSAVEVLSHAGPITRTVRDAALMLNSMAGADSSDPLSLPVETNFLTGIQKGITGLRIAWSSNLGYASIDPEVHQICSKAAASFSELGCSVEEIHPNIPDPWENIVHVIWASAFAGLYLHKLDEVQELMDPGLVDIIKQGDQISASKLAKAHSQRNEYYQNWCNVLKDFDLLLTSTLPITAFQIGQDKPREINGRSTTYLGWSAFTYPFNITGHPAATLPCGFTRNGMPVGLQVVGQWRDDITVLRASAAFEKFAPWADIRPPLEQVSKPQ